VPVAVNCWVPPESSDTPEAGEMSM